MKIAMLSTFYPFRGGIAQFNANLYKTLCKKHDVIPYTFTRQYPDFLFPGKTQYVTKEDNAIPIDSIPSLDTANPFSYKKCAMQIAAEQPDILLMKYWTSYLAPSLGTVAKHLKNNGCRVVTILDNVIPHEQKFFDKPLTTWFLKQNNGFVTMSEAVQVDLQKLLPTAHSIMKTHPLYDHFGEKIERERACELLGLNQDKKILLFFGLIRDYKGLDLLIDAFDQLGDGYQLVIAGESYGSFDKYWEQIKKARHIDNIFVFNYYIKDDEVSLFFSAADVCVLPYKTATQSGITSIAYHFEVPLIATRTGGLSESIERAGIGLMVPEISVASITETIIRFFKYDSFQFKRHFKQEKESLSWDSFAEAIVSNF